MSIFTIITLAVGLSMDAFAVAICKGLAMKKLSLKKALIIGGYFGFFQAFMPVIGYLLGVSFKDYITSVDHWIAFVLLSLIGINMIREALSKEEDKDEANDSTSFKVMIVLAIATSIDALAVGVTFAFLSVNIIFAALTIGVITFALSLVGVKIGNVFGIHYKAKAEFVGGLVLVLLGLKILFEHLGIF